ncbi:MAG: CHAD domain-containing protein [Neptuniibacter sp.]
MRGKQVIDHKMKSTLYKDVKKLQKRMQLQSEIDGELIHDIRVLCKRVRAESLLLKSKAKKAVLKGISKQLAGSLSQIRDAEVMLETFDRLMVPADSIEPLKGLRQKLEVDLNQQTLDSDRLFAMIQLLRQEVGGCSFNKHPIKLNKASLLMAEKRSFKKFLRLNVNDCETYHDWRKTVKAYLYLFKLKAGMHDKKLEKVKALAEALGLLHGLHVFEATVHQRHNEYLEQLRGILMLREKFLLAEVHRLGSELYRRKEEVFQSEKTG